MIQNCRIVDVRCTDPYQNLAVEELLLKQVKDDEIILYLWQNANTVVIGRNQDALQECDTDRLLSEGGHLARRLSGGGAVYHDLGNVNFTFLTTKNNHDVSLQTRVIRDAAASFGIRAECTGRNDLTVDGRKFSGCAYYDDGRARYHHGTILIDSDLDKMSRYLTPSKKKLSSKGVASVASRVVCLKQYSEDISPVRFKEAMVSALCCAYRIDAGPKYNDDTLPLDMELVGSRQKFYADRAWLFSRQIAYTHKMEFRTTEGLFTIHALTRNGIIEDAEVYSDSMNVNAAAALREKLPGQRYNIEEIEKIAEEIHYADPDSGR